MSENNITNAAIIANNTSAKSSLANSLTATLPTPLTTPLTTPLASPPINSTNISFSHPINPSNATATAVASVTQTAKYDGVTNKTVAGIGAGTAFAGAFLALFGIWIF